MTFPNTPVVNGGLLYVNGLELSWASTTTLNLSAGQARDSSDSNDLVLQPVYASGVLQPSAVITSTFVGPNGVDQAAVVANSFYAVYVIGSSSSVYTSTNALAGGPSPNPLGPIPLAAPVVKYPVAGLLSLASNAAPYLPFGYDMYRRIGWVSTDGSGNLLKFYQFYSDDQSRQYWYDVPRALGYTATTSTGPTNYVEIPLVAGAVPTTNPNPLLVPPYASQVYLNVAVTGATAGDVVNFLPYGSTSTGVGIVRFQAPLASSVGSVSVPYGVDSIHYPTPSSTVSAVPVPAILYSAASTSDIVVLTVSGFLDLL